MQLIHSHPVVMEVRACFSLLSAPSASLHVRTVRTVGKGPSGGTGGPVNGTVVRSAEEKTAEYAVFALVPIFCVMGLLGILICNILKKKGYRCSADKEGGDEETATPQKEGERGSERKWKAEGKTFAESSICVHVIVMSCHKNAKLALMQAHNVVKWCQSKAKPGVFVCSHSGRVSLWCECTLDYMGGSFKKKKNLFELWPQQGHYMFS